MKEEKNILEATEYIHLALNTISNFNEFIEYKEEIEKALYDIRNSLLNLISTKSAYEEQKRLNKSSIMDLKYNYDAILNPFFVPKKNKDNFSTNSEKNKIISNKNLENNKNNKVNNNKVKKKLFKNEQDKVNKIADIIIKLNSKDYYYIILTKLFGNDLKEKLVSNKVSNELLAAVQNSIQEIEALKKKDEMKNSKKEDKLKNLKSLEEMEEEPRQFPVNEIIGPNDKYKNYKKINYQKNNYNINDLYQEYDFIKNLRKDTSKKMNNSDKKVKPFISATSIYGNYFDPPLQKGGISKLDDYKK